MSPVPYDPANLICVDCRKDPSIDPRLEPGQSWVAENGDRVCRDHFVKRRIDSRDPIHTPITGGELKPEQPPADHVFTSGARRSVRDSRHFHSITAQFLDRVARRQAEGDLQYGEYNWRKGLPWQDTFNHIIAHLFHWKAEIEAGRVPADDDLAGAAVGIEFLMFREEFYAMEMQARVPPDPHVA